MRCLFDELLALDALGSFFHFQREIDEQTTFVGFSVAPEERRDKLKNLGWKRQKEGILLQCGRPCQRKTRSFLRNATAFDDDGLEGGQRMWSSVCVHIGQVVRQNHACDDLSNVVEE